MILEVFEVGWASKCEVVVRTGELPDGGTDKRNVVDVPNDKRAEPGAGASAATVAGLSPVKGATTQSHEEISINVMTATGRANPL